MQRLLEIFFFILLLLLVGSCYNILPVQNGTLDTEPSNIASVKLSPNCNYLSTIQHNIGNL